MFVYIFLRIVKYVIMYKWDIFICYVYMINSKKFEYIVILMNIIKIFIMRRLNN